MSGNQEDDDDGTERSEVRYVAMPTLQALQLMRNRMQMAMLGKRLMKWKAVAATRELSGISQSLVVSAERVYGTDLPGAYMLLARCRYLDPDFTKFVLEDVQLSAQIRTTLCKSYAAGVKVMSFEPIVTGPFPYEMHSLPKAGRVLQEAADAFQKLVIDLIEQLQSRAAFTSVEGSQNDATRKMNVMGKVVIPRALATIAYIQNEMEESGREDYYRMKKIIYIKKKRQQEYQHIRKKEKKIAYEMEKSYIHLKSRSKMGFPLYEVDSVVDVNKDDLSHRSLGRPESNLSRASLEKVAFVKTDVEEPIGLDKKRMGIVFSDEVLIDPDSPPTRHVSSDTQLSPILEEYLAPSNAPQESFFIGPRQAPRYPIQIPAGVPFIICGGYILPVFAPETSPMPGSRAGESSLPCEGCRRALLMLETTGPFAQLTQIPSPVPVEEAVEPLAIGRGPNCQTEPLWPTLSPEDCSGRTKLDVVSKTTSPMSVCSGNSPQAAAGPLLDCRKPHANLPTGVCGEHRCQEPAGLLAISWKPEFHRPVPRAVSPIDIYRDQIRTNNVPEVISPVDICSGHRTQAAAPSPLMSICGVPDSRRMVSRASSPINICGARRMLQTISLMGANDGNIAPSAAMCSPMVVSRESSPLQVCGRRWIPHIESKKSFPKGVCGRDRPQTLGSAVIGGVLFSQSATSSIEVCVDSNLPKSVNAIPKTIESYNRYISLDPPLTRDKSTAVLCRRCAAHQEKEFKRNIQQNVENARGRFISTADNEIGRESTSVEANRLEVNLVIPHFLLKTINGIKIITNFFVSNSDSNGNVGIPVIVKRDTAGPTSVCPGGMTSSGGNSRREVSITEIEDMGCQCDLGRDEQVKCTMCRLMNARGATVTVRSSKIFLTNRSENKRRTS